MHACIAIYFYGSLNIDIKTLFIYIYMEIRLLRSNENIKLHVLNAFPTLLSIVFKLECS